MAKQKRPKAGIRRGKPDRSEEKYSSRVRLLDEGEDLNKLYNIFGVSDENDIADIVHGGIGFDDY